MIDGKFDVRRIQDRVLGDLIDWNAEHFSDAVWLRMEANSVSYSVGRDVIRKYAAGLQAIGIKTGDLVAMLARTSIDAILLAHACGYIGAVFTVLNTELRGNLLDDAIEAAGPAALIVDIELVGSLATLDPGRLSHVWTLGEGTSSMGKSAAELLDHGDSPERVDVAWSDPLQVCWTSGTSGRSKGVVHTHSSVLHHAESWLPSECALPGDVMYVCTPFYLSGAWNCGIWVATINGLTAALDRAFSVSKFWDRVRYYGVNHIFTLGAMHIYLWNQEPRAGDTDNAVRRAMCSPMDWELIPRFKKRFGIGRMDQLYGSTESYTVIGAADDGTTWPKHAMGRVMPYVQVKLLDANDEEVVDGEIGEICIRPLEPGVMFSGYWRAPEATLMCWRNLWQHQGDLARRDSDGIYYFADRLKDSVRYAGRNISLQEVEMIAAEYPDVSEVAGFGVTSAEVSSEAELALAVVVRRGSIFEPEKLARFINDRAPYYFVPRYIEEVDELPKNSHYKVLKDVLRKRGVSDKAWDRQAAGFIAKRIG